MRELDSIGSTGTSELVNEKESEMKLAVAKKAASANPAPDAINQALEVFTAYEARRNEIRDVRQDLDRAERALAEAVGQVERTQKIQAAGGKMDARAAVKIRDEWAGYVESLKGTLADFEKHLSLLRTRIERLDLAPLTAEVEELTRQQRTLERRLRRGFYDDAEEPEAKRNLAEVQARLKSLQPCAEGLGEVQTAARLRVALRSSLPAIESAAKRFEVAMREAEAAHQELVGLGQKVGRLPDFFVFRMALGERSAQRYLDVVRGEVG